MRPGMADGISVRQLPIAIEVVVLEAPFDTLAHEEAVVLLISDHLEPLVMGLVVQIVVLLERKVKLLPICVRPSCRLSVDGICDLRRLCLSTLRVHHRLSRRLRLLRSSFRSGLRPLSSFERLLRLRAGRLLGSLGSLLCSLGGRDRSLLRFFLLPRLAPFVFDVYPCKLAALDSLHLLRRFVVQDSPFLSPLDPLKQPQRGDYRPDEDLHGLPSRLFPRCHETLQLLKEGGHLRVTVGEACVARVLHNLLSDVVLAHHHQLLQHAALVRAEEDHVLAKLIVTRLAVARQQEQLDEILSLHGEHKVRECIFEAVRQVLVGRTARIALLHELDALDGAGLLELTKDHGHVELDGREVAVGFDATDEVRVGRCDLSHQLLEVDQEFLADAALLLCRRRLLLLVASGGASSRRHLPRGFGLPGCGGASQIQWLSGVESDHLHDDRLLALLELGLELRGELIHVLLEEVGARVANVASEVRDDKRNVVARATLDL
mmetsp:Transcript_18478/g.41322  ORF Transcript_18478/g.41322 Transcript_18478/m.41322 type:complete len:491 (+) Transcript_18478:827-2299(+)